MREFLRNQWIWSTGYGPPWEIIIDFCNETRINPWICLPHLATDDYVQQLAILFRDQLDVSLTVYIEHSNEVWNSQFPQYQWARQRGAGLSNQEYLQVLYGYAQRSKETTNLFKSIVGSRAVRVVGSHAVNVWSSEQILSFAGPGSYDTLAVAPYWAAQLGNKTSTLNMSTDQILDACDQDIDVQFEFLQQQSQLAEEYGIDLSLYEDGQHLTPFGSMHANADLAAKFDIVNRHPRMFNLYVKHLSKVKSIENLRVAMEYHLSGLNGLYGSWGLWLYPWQPITEAHKARAVRSFMN